MAWTSTFITPGPTSLPTTFAPSSSVWLNTRTVHYVNRVCVSFAGLSMNALLIGLLVTERNREMRAYSRVLFQNSLIDVIFTLIVSFTELQSEFVDGRLYLFISGPLRGLPMPYVYFQAFVWLSACVSVLLMPPIIFYYRYVLLVKGYRLSGVKLLRLTVVPLLCSLHQGAVIIVAAMQSDHERPAACYRILQVAMWREIRYSACLIAEPLNWLLIYVMVMAYVMITAAYGIMGYCTFAVMRHLKASKGQLSPTTIKLQKQMNVMLIAQMVLPLIFGLLPVLGMVFFITLHINVPGAATLMTMGVTWIPGLNALSTLIFFALFRRRVRSPTFDLCALRVRGHGRRTARKILPNMTMLSSTNNNINNDINNNNNQVASSDAATVRVRMSAPNVRA